MLVKELMLNTTAKLCPEDTIREAVKLLRKSKLNGIPIIDRHDRLIGIFTRSNLYDSLLGGASLNDPLAPYYIKEVVYLEKDYEFGSIMDVNDWLRNAHRAQTPVVDQKLNPIGTVDQATTINFLINEVSILYTELLCVLDSIPNGIIATDEAGRILLCNPFVERILHSSKGAFLGKRVQQIFTGVDLGWIIPGQEMKPQKMEINSAKIVVSGSVFHQDGAAKGAIIVFHDATEIEAMACELEIVKKLYMTLETVLEIAYDGIATVDDQGVITLANKAFGDLTGNLPAKLVGKSLKEVLGFSVAVQYGGNKPEIHEINGNICVLLCNPIADHKEVKGAVVKIIYRQLDQLKEIIDQINFLKTRLDYYKEELHKLNGTRYTFDNIITKSKSLEKIINKAEMVAKGESTILLYGESGTGKELFAHAIHNASHRVKEPFIKINCAAVPLELAESELFGYEPGAFTGAQKRVKPGKFELADSGTIFLDEVGDMPLPLQAKLLRVIQEKEVERIGGTRPITVNVRIIAATNKDLKQLVAEKRFREDLYYRLNVIGLEIPPLRQRPEDIPLLLKEFISKIGKKVATNIRGVSPEAVQILSSFQWPGNIRELENVVERVISLNVDDDWIMPGHLQFLKDVKGHSCGVSETKETSNERDYRTALAATEKEVILKALELTSGNKSKAASILGMSRSNFYEKLKKLNIIPNHQFN